MKAFKEFKEFISKGNVMDMAVGVIIGGAFGKIVTSLVNDVLMPLLGIITGGIDFTTLTIHRKNDVIYLILKRRLSDTNLLNKSSVNLYLGEK